MNGRHLCLRWINDRSHNGEKNRRMSPLGPGCVKTCLSQGCAELFSQFPSLDRTGKCNWFLHRQNREGISTRKLNVRVFTQTGSKPEKLNASICFPVYPRNRTSLNAVSMSGSCQNQKSSAAWVMFR